MAYTVGIDAGSRAIKAVVWDVDKQEIRAKGIVDQGVAQEALAADLLDRILHEHGLKRSDIGNTVATGYGRNLISWAQTTITEITCHGRGVRALAPDARTIIDIGGQDSKLIRLGTGGDVEDFAMNDRCAAGTGRFIEVVSLRLDMPFDAMADHIALSTKACAISSMCVVFAETEIIGLMASGARPEDILAGVQNSIAQRTVGMAGRKVEEPIYFTGGVALVPGMWEALGNALQREVHVPRYPHSPERLAQRYWRRKENSSPHRATEAQSRIYPSLSIYLCAFASLWIILVSYPNQLLFLHLHCIALSNELHFEPGFGRSFGDLDGHWRITGWHRVAGQSHRQVFYLFQFWS